MVVPVDLMGTVDSPRLDRTRRVTDCDLNQLTRDLLEASVSTDRVVELVDVIRVVQAPGLNLESSADRSDLTQ